MKTTDLALSKQIYAAFPEWDDESLTKRYIVGGNAFTDDTISNPFYTTDYLLDKLQSLLPKGEYVAISADNDSRGKWFASISTDHALGDTAYADTPAEALGLLALELKRQGVL